MVRNSWGVKPILGALASAAVLTLAGCNALYGGSSRATSAFTTVPSVYALATDGNVAKATLDHSQEYIVLSASLDEYPFPTTWAAQANYASTFSQTVAKADATTYARYIQIGLGDTAKVFTATIVSDAPVYTSSDGTTLPSSSLSAANQQWYYEAMEAGTFYVLASATAITADNSLVDFTKDGSSAYVAAKADRWKKSTTDAAWKAGRDQVLAFVLNRVLYGTAGLALTVVDGVWKVGITSTGITEVWPLDQYYHLLVTASSTTATSSSGTDTTTAATSE
jgi:hypothetical protein